MGVKAEKIHYKEEETERVNKSKQGKGKVFQVGGTTCEKVWVRDSNRDIETETEKWKERDTHRLKETETDK